MEQEIWKQVKNSKFYAVSNAGKIKRLAHKKWCKVNNSYSNFKEKELIIDYNNTKKYGRINIYFEDGSNKICGIHRLVAETFIPNPKELEQVNHIDGDKTNNHYSNLEWCNQSQNMRHRIDTLNIKNWKKGEDCHWKKLTEEQVKEIPNLLANGFKKNKIAKMFNVCPTTITELTKGRSWKHLNLF